MLLTASNGTLTACAVNCSGTLTACAVNCSGGRDVPFPTLMSRLLLLRAVPLRVVQLLAFLGRRRFDLRADDVTHRLHPVGNDVPFLAVPLLDEHGAVALVVLAGRLHRVGEALHAELVQRR